VELILGPDATAVPASIVAGSASSSAPAVAPSSAAASPSPGATSSSNDGQAGGTVKVAQSAPYGIPCVY
jgi:hypothetical protein